MTHPAEMDQLKRFHALHFPKQAIPNLDGIPRKPSQEEDSYKDPCRDQADGLGCYEDGVKRTLTEEQVQMFRHSEIQRLLNERRAARDKEEKLKRRPENRKQRGGAPPRGKRRFEDQPEQGHTNIDALMYDDEPSREEGVCSTAQRFLWPTLGRG